MRVLIAVTHLLGIGHLSRAASLARALELAGHEVTLVSGGMPGGVTGRVANLLQLPPLRSDGVNFSKLLDETGAPASDDLMARRRDMLCDALISTTPDVVVTELFPFGRRQLADEFLALIEAAHTRRPRPAIVASIRDILVAPAKEGRVAETHARLASFYDGVLVHGDPDLIPLDASWPLDEALRPLIHYTGYVDGDTVPEPVGVTGDIVVSGGGSPAALPLFQAAISAAHLTPDRHWRLLISARLQGVERDLLIAAAPPNLSIEPTRPDFRAILAAARVSVSQAGYNTMLDLAATGVWAVVVPFDEGRETEQTQRATCFAAKGLVVPLAAADLSAHSLIKAIAEAEAAPPPSATFRANGAARSVDILSRIAAARRAG